MLKAVFLDRDGVINRDRDKYVRSLAELEVFPYAAESIRRLNEAGFEAIVVSNQQGVAKGLVSQEDLLAIQDEITRRVASGGGRIAGFYYCPHLAQDGCSCRKPEPGLILRAAKEHGIDLAASVMIGDSDRDVLAGKRAGCRTVLVLSGLLTREQVENAPCKPDFVAGDLSEAADYVVNPAAQRQKH